MTLPLPASAELDPAVQRLRSFAIADAAATFAGAGLALAVHLASTPSGYLVLMSVLCVAASAVMAAALLPLRRNDLRRGLLLLAAANWSLALAGAAITVFAWPVMVLAALLPAVLAPTLVGRSELGWFVYPSLLAASASVMMGVTQDFSGISARAPEWLRNIVLIGAVTVLAGLIAVITTQHHLRMQAELDRSLAARAALAHQTLELQRSRTRVVAAADRERRRIERDLHDGAQQRLIALKLRLRAAKVAIGDATGVLDELSAEVQTAHDELRRLAQGLYPPVLSEHGLAEALRSAADRCPNPVVVSLPDVGRLSPEVETAVYFCCVEALQNSAKHAPESRVELRIGRDDGSVWFEVHDDGPGFSRSVPDGVGLLNMQDRIGAAGGTISISSGPSGGCDVSGRLPTV
jgi:signal transduction histidine kinase